MKKIKSKIAHQLKKTRKFKDYVLIITLILSLLSFGLGIYNSARIKSLDLLQHNIIENVLFPEKE